MPAKLLFISTLRPLVIPTGCRCKQPDGPKRLYRPHRRHGADIRPL